MARGIGIRVKLNEDERLVSRFLSPQALVVRPRIILQAAKRCPNKEIPATLGVNPASVTFGTQRLERGQENK